MLSLLGAKGLRTRLSKKKLTGGASLDISTGICSEKNSCLQDEDKNANRRNRSPP